MTSPNGGTPPAVASVTLSRDTATLVTAAMIQLTATAVDASGQTLSRTVAWTSSDETRARVTNGLVTAVAPGAATITATVEGKSASAQVTIAEGGVVSTSGGVITARSGAVQLTSPAGAVSQAISVFVKPATSQPSDPGLVAGTTVELAPSTTTFSQPVVLALRYDAASLGSEIRAESLRIFVLSGGTWQAVPGGAADAITRVVSAPISRLGSYAVVGELRVSPPPVAIVEVSPGTGSLYAGKSLQLSATTKDAQGQTLTGRMVTWSSSNPGSATVTAGLVSAGAFGSATITATSEGVSASATIKVLHDPIMFVHGFQSSGAIWGTMINSFTADGWTDSPLVTWSYDSNQSNTAIAQILQAKVDSLLAAAGATKVDIITHSMGGLSSRYFAKSLGGSAKIDGFVALGTPNHGTTTANLCGIVTCLEMRPGSAFLTALNADDETPGPPRYATWWSACDQVTTPPESVILTGATNTQTACLQHSQLYVDGTLYQQVRDWVR